MALQQELSLHIQEDSVRLAVESSYFFPIEEEKPPTAVHQDNQSHEQGCDMTLLMLHVLPQSVGTPHTILRLPCCSGLAL